MTAQSGVSHGYQVTTAEPETFESAVRHTCRAVPVVQPATTLAEIKKLLWNGRYDSVTHIVVCDDARFVGILRIEDALPAPDNQTAGDLMDSEAPRIGPHTDREIAAWTATQHGESALAVVDEAGQFKGLIPPSELLRILLTEHEEDLARLGGYLRQTSTARLASEEPIARRFLHRLPWLLLGLGGAMAAADIVRVFEQDLQKNVSLAFFVAGVVYLADAVGTQTETVVVRGMSIGVPIRRVLTRELLTGLAIGLVLAGLALPLLFFRWGDWRLALGVSMSLAAACSTATIAAMGLPWVFNRAGIDPAFGSGPLATVIQDLASIIIYFLIVSSVVA
jgi:magnesium transporter